MSTPISYFLVLSSILFAIGSVGVLVRKNALIIFMSVELQLNAVNRTVRNYVPHFLPWVYEVHPDLWATQ